MQNIYEIYSRHDPKRRDRTAGSPARPPPRRQAPVTATRRKITAQTVACPRRLRLLRPTRALSAWRVPRRRHLAPLPSRRRHRRRTPAASDGTATARRRHGDGTATARRRHGDGTAAARRRHGATPHWGRHVAEREELGTAARRLGSTALDRSTRRGCSARRGCYARRGGSAKLRLAELLADCLRTHTHTQSGISVGRKGGADARPSGRESGGGWSEEVAARTSDRRTTRESFSASRRGNTARARAIAVWVRI